MNPTFLSVSGTRAWQIGVVLRRPFDLCHDRAVGNKLAVDWNALAERLDHHRIPHDRFDAAV
jgi:hypothetical protein